MGTESGEFCIYDGDSWEIFNMASYWGPNNSVTAISIDRDGVKWFGTEEEGLGMYDGRQLLSYYKNNSGISGNDVICLATRTVGDSTEVWASTYDLDSHTHAGIPIYSQSLVSGVEAERPLPGSVDLLQNYPNPFNPVTTIRFSVATTGPVSLNVYDTAGREVRTLVNETKRPGTYRVLLDVSNWPSGVYSCRLQTAGHMLTRKMLLVK